MLPTLIHLFYLSAGGFNRAPFTEWTPVSVDILVLVLLFSNIIPIDFPCRRGRYWNRRSRTVCLNGPSKDHPSNRWTLVLVTCFSCFIRRLSSPDTHNSVLISSELKSLSVRKLRPFKSTEVKKAAPVLKTEWIKTCLRHSFLNRLGFLPESSFAAVEERIQTCKKASADRQQLQRHCCADRKAADLLSEHMEWTEPTDSVVKLGLWQASLLYNNHTRKNVLLKFKHTF